jgi:glycerate kinase
MKVLISTDSFKDCLAAKDVCENLKKGLLKVSPGFEVRTVPVGDGGEGTVDALLEANKGSLVHCKVQDPLGRERTASYGISGDRKTAIIEMASASGIELLKKEERNPWITSTYGTGQLIKDALDKGCRRFICGIGGSATNDGGVGMASALGIQFLNDKNEPVGRGGGELLNISKIDLSMVDPRIVE